MKTKTHRHDDYLRRIISMLQQNFNRIKERFPTQLPCHLLWSTGDIMLYSRHGLQFTLHPFHLTHERRYRLRLFLVLAHVFLIGSLHHLQLMLYGGHLARRLLVALLHVVVVRELRLLGLNAIVLFWDGLLLFCQLFLVVWCTLWNIREKYCGIIKQNKRKLAPKLLIMGTKHSLSKLRNKQTCHKNLHKYKRQSYLQSWNTIPYPLVQCRDSRTTFSSLPKCPNLDWWGQGKETL